MTSTVVPQFVAVRSALLYRLLYFSPALGRVTEVRGGP
jgi:hypothetical protein